MTEYVADPALCASDARVPEISLIKPEAVGTERTSRAPAITTANVIVEIRTDDGRELCGVLVLNRAGSLAVFRRATRFYESIEHVGLYLTIEVDGLRQSGLAVGVWQT